MISAVKENLYQLSVIRAIILGCEILALVFFSKFRDIGLPVSTLGIILLLHGVVIAATWHRSLKTMEITELEFFCQVLIDVFFFTILLYFSGGASNPFVSYYLVPVSIVAGTLSLRYTCVTTLLCLGAYSALLIDSFPISAFSPDLHHRHHQENNSLHIIGMWGNFVMSALFITFFVTRMAGALKKQSSQIATHRENQLRDEQVIGIGALAAGTAHELGTPLNTMKILVDEMRQDKSNFNQDIDILRGQIEQCRITLRQLVATADITANNKEARPIRQYVNQLLERWQVLHPELNVSVRFIDNPRAREAFFYPTIAQSLLNLLNNAADASPEQVDVSVFWNEEKLEFSIRDYGKGLSSYQKDILNKPFSSEKKDGLGIGLFLTHASINRYGGSVTIMPADNRGVLTKVSLPLIFEPISAD